MARKFFFGILIFVLMTTLVVPQHAAKAEPVAEFFAAPSAVMAGGEVTFLGAGFNANNTVELSLVTPDTFPLGDLSTDDTGTFHEVLSLPALPAIVPGDYQVVALPDNVSTNLTVLPAITLGLTPNAGTPGTSVHFMVENLVSGQLRLDYDGVPIYGPVDVPAGIFEGDFLVPADRPVAFPGDVAVIATNSIGNQTIGKAITFFLADTPLWPIYGLPDYQIQITEVPPSPVAPGYPFTLQGIISPPPQEPLNLYEMKLLRKSGSGQVVPITVGPPLLLPDGSFTINGHAPSLFGGDPLLPGFETGGSVGVVFIDKKNGGNSTAGFAPWIDPPFPVFKVKVVDENGSPIP